MSKTLLIAFLMAFAFLSSCSRSPTPPAPDDKAADRNLSPRGEVMSVLVEFNGLMVFHKVEPTIPVYEVGVLAPQISHGHKFTVLMDNVPQTLINGARWTLEITSSVPPASAQPINVPGRQRLNDTPETQYNFDWIVDLEGTEFHNQKLDLKKGLLVPIIRLPAAPLYTLFKSFDLIKEKGDGTSSEFGFVSETIAMNIRLQPGQDLVLKDDSTGKAIFTLPYSSVPRLHTVKIENVRRPASQDSDFGMYYELFNGIDKKDRFDFSENKGSNRLPLNLSPYRDVIRIQKMTPTCCGLLCDAVLLGSRTDPLW
jgi:hypothetical protein